ncbi:hypothetical protein ZIOFF_068151 [Zingiber officinale]|uniref:Phosphoadenosine phosphosulphate reductase domain-containing protein n=1 Tax=Zingiber officinale TaxID=94328 RepID=A0A8J5ERN0_ZINOF|nr:hypothetical protein ZIOFF_068151 [Zingiber officinale]
MANECCSIQLIDGDGVFNVTSLEHYMKSVKLAEHGFSYAVVSIMGPQSSGKRYHFQDAERSGSWRKVRPLRRMLKGLREWITGQRKDQSPSMRANIPGKDNDHTQKREARREEKEEKVAVPDMVFRRCTGYLEDAQVEKI